MNHVISKHKNKERSRTCNAHLTCTATPARSAVIPSRLLLELARLHRNQLQQHKDRRKDLAVLEPALAGQFHAHQILEAGGQQQHVDAPGQPVQCLPVLVPQVHPDADDDAKVRVTKIATKKGRKHEQPLAGADRGGRQRSGGHFDRQNDGEHEKGQQIDQHFKLRNADPLDHVEQFEVGLDFDLVGHLPAAAGAAA